MDFEVNNDEGAASIMGVVDGVDIRRVQDLPALGFDGYAIAAGGYSSATKQSMMVQERHRRPAEHDHPRHRRSHGDWNNVSDVPAVADFPGCENVTFSDNIRITQE